MDVTTIILLSGDHCGAGGPDHLTISGELISSPDQLISTTPSCISFCTYVL
jgi:hypothetical protein